MQTDMENPPPSSAEARDQTLVTELLVLHDGRILVHNLTPVFAEVLKELNPEDPHFAARAAAPVHAPSDHEFPG